MASTAIVFVTVVATVTIAVDVAISGIAVVVAVASFASDAALQPDYAALDLVTFAIVEAILAELANPVLEVTRLFFEAIGLDPKAVDAGLEGLAGVTGRMEWVDLGQPFGVVIDYAHSPKSLEVVLDQ